MKFLVIVNLIALSSAQLIGKTNILRRGSTQLLAESLPEELGRPEPYSFSYSADAIDGRSARQETSDESGVVRGSYMISSADGIQRTVNYVADVNGFRAQIQTNEPGTESKSPANVQLDSSQPPAEEIALKFGPRPVQKLAQVGLNSVLTETRAPLQLSQTLGQTLIQQKELNGLPLVKNVDTLLTSTGLSNGLNGQLLPLQTPLKPLESPTRLLNRFPTSQFSSLVNTQYRPQLFDVQQREELLSQQENLQTREKLVQTRETY